MSLGFGSLLGIYNRSIRAKFLVISALIFITLFGAASTFLIHQNVIFQKESLLSRAKTFSTLATKPIGDSYNLYFSSGHVKFREDIINTLSLNTDIIRLQIISVNGKILFDSVNLDDFPILEPRNLGDNQILKLILRNTTSELTDSNGDVKEIVVPYFDDFGGRPFSIRYFISYESVYDTANQIIFAIVFLSVVALVLTTSLMAFLVDRSILRPVGKVADAAKEISHGNIDKRIELPNKDELGELAGALNQMTSTLRKNIEDLKDLDKLKDEFIYLVSHNLRSPLTVMKGYVGVLKSNKSLDAAAVKVLERISSGTEQLGELVESLLNLVSLEKNKQPLSKKEINLRELIEKIARNFGEKATEKKISLILKLPKDAVPKIEADERRLSQVLSSLIDNAIKFNRDKGTVTIELEERKGKVLISTRDTGIGIAKEERAKVFQKFHRATDMLTYNYEGVGLGLYLTKLIIEAHQGKIWFESELGRGTTFYIELPIKEAHPGG